MRKFCALFLGVLMVACGSESSSPEAPAGGPGDPTRPVGAVPFDTAFVVPTTDWAKVVLNTRTLLAVPVCILDDQENCSTVSCTSDTDCTAHPGSSCSNGVCATSQPVDEVLYVRDLATTADFPVPCDGRLYSVQVYGAIGGALGNGTTIPTIPHRINEVHTTSLTMSTACAVSAHTWTQMPASDFPQLAVPSVVYAGLGGVYQVNVLNLRNPWAGWTVACGGGTPTYNGTTATFAAPLPAPVGTQVTCTGDASLASSLLTNAIPWRWTLAQSFTPVQTSGVPMP